MKINISASLSPAQLSYIKLVVDAACLVDKYKDETLEVTQYTAFSADVILRSSQRAVVVTEGGIGEAL